MEFPQVLASCYNAHTVYMQADNGGIIMTTFVTFFVNCSSPENATVSDVAGTCIMHVEV